MTRGRRAALLVGAITVVAATGVMGTLLLRTPTPTAAAGAPRFVDETTPAGLAHRYDGGDLFQVGGGVAVLDCDGDRRPDLYLAGGEGPAAMFRNASEVGGPLRFTRVKSVTTDLTNVNGAYPIDFDGDGNVDLVVLRIGESRILRSLGHCTFEDATGGLGITGLDGHMTAFSATWEDDDELPTLAFGRYLKVDESGNRILECADNALLRPPPGQGVPAYAAPVTLSPGYCALSMLFSDWDRSGRRDLRVTNDREWYRDGMDQLWRIETDLPPTLYTAGEGWVSMQIWGMGIASRDLTGDGLPEVYLTSQGDNKLQTLTAGSDRPTFRDIALRRGVNSAQPFAGGESLPSTAWHPEFADVNNDGFVDLFVTKGNVGAQAGYATRDPNDLFLGQPDGTFAQAADAAGLLRYERGRGAALADLNLDGLLDVVVVNYGAEAVAWRNAGSGTAANPVRMGHWAMIDLVDDDRNRMAIGAVIEARIGDLLTTIERTIGGGHVGGQLGWVHLGLGPATSAEVRVTWPDGSAGPWQRLNADAFWILERDAAPVRWSAQE